MRTSLFGAAICAALALAGAAKAESRDPALASWRLSAQGATDDVLRALSQRFELHRHGDAWEVIAPAADGATVQALAPAAVLVDPDMQASMRAHESIDPEYFAGYRNFTEVERYLQALAAARPDIAKLETFGTSRDGKPLYVLKLSDNVTEDEDEPELMLTAATHGDEIITTEVVLGLLQELVDGYGSNERLTAMVQNHELFFIPVVNPDGFSQRSRYANGIDPNRDFPYPTVPTRRSNPAIAGMISFFHAHQIVGSLDFHASGQIVMWPWAYTRDVVDSAADLAFRNLARDMAAANGYRTGQISRVMYIAEGSSADYFFWKKGTLAYGIELTYTKAPPTSQIPSVVTEAREMTWKFIENF